MVSSVELNASHALDQVQAQTAAQMQYIQHNDNSPLQALQATGASSSQSANNDPSFYNSDQFEENEMQILANTISQMQTALSEGLQQIQNSINDVSSS